MILAALKWRSSSAGLNYSKGFFLRDSAEAGAAGYEFLRHVRVERNQDDDAARHEGSRQAMGVGASL
jgi:hypothetical protein